MSRLPFKKYQDNFGIQLSFCVAAVFVGFAGVYFGKLVANMHGFYARFFDLHPILMSFLTPLGILAGAAVIRFAPMAGGSGVPQVLYAAMIAREKTDPTERELVSFRTSIVKTISTGLGFLFGASIGAEGPLVQISTSIFAEAAAIVKRKFPNVDFKSFIAAGAGTGIAAAFNAPLGGIAFTLEEVATTDFGELRHFVVLAIIVAGLTAQALIGNELYFGSFSIGHYERHFVEWALVIGTVGGLMGALFGKIVSSTKLLRVGWNWWTRALIFGVLIAVLEYFSHGDIGGSSFTVTRDALIGDTPEQSLLFPVAKLFATAFSTLSGLGGGILAPSLSVGAWLGISTAKLALYSNFEVCALLGMVAYFSGTFQIPITSVIVVMEITNQHEVIFPMMIAALVAYMVARVIMPVSLYHLLLEKMFVHPSAKELDRATVF